MQPVVLPPRATDFRAVCAAGQAEQPPSRRYIGAIVKGELSLDEEQVTVFCVRGHGLGLVRESKTALLCRTLR